MERLDGNAIGGVLAEIFGTEMTVAVGVCGSCGATGPVAELHVYMRAPGIVVRCSTCESVLLKIVQSDAANLARPQRPAHRPVRPTERHAVDLAGWGRVGTPLGHRWCSHLGAASADTRSKRFANRSAAHRRHGPS